MTGNQQTPSKLFSVEEANQRLPLIRAIVRDIVELFPDVQSRRRRLEAVQQRRGQANPGPLYSEELDQMEQELQRDEDRLRSFIRELQELGVEFKDPALGLVDFPSEIDGRQVYLCWKLGEPEVRFWHELQVGFSGRQPLYAESVLGSEQNDIADDHGIELN